MSTWWHGAVWPHQARRFNCSVQVICWRHEEEASISKRFWRSSVPVYPSALCILHYLIVEVWGWGWGGRISDVTGLFWLVQTETHLCCHLINPRGRLSRTCLCFWYVFSAFLTNVRIPLRKQKCWRGEDIKINLDSLSSWSQKNSLYFISFR